MNIQKRVQAPEGALPLTPSLTISKEPTRQMLEQAEQAKVTDLRQAKRRTSLSGQSIEIAPLVQQAQGYERASPTQ